LGVVSVHFRQDLCLQGGRFFRVDAFVEEGDLLLNRQVFGVDGFTEFQGRNFPAANPVERHEAVAPLRGVFPELACFLGNCPGGGDI
jgi:hypothetical protein